MQRFCSFLHLSFITYTVKLLENMKKYILLILLSIISLNIFAQEKKEFKNNVGISPLQLFNGVRVKYERSLNNEITLGGIITGYYQQPKYHSFPGVQLAPIARYYFMGKAHQGFYAQAKILSGIYSTEIEIDIYDKPYTPDFERTLIKTEHRKYAFTRLGGGIAIGCQLIWGDNKRLVLDVNLGFKYMGDVTTPTIKDNEEIFPCNHHLADWFVMGPGSIIDGLISLGYRF